MAPTLLCIIALNLFAPTSDQYKIMFALLTSKFLFRHQTRLLQEYNNISLFPKRRSIISVQSQQRKLQRKPSCAAFNPLSLHDFLTNHRERNCLCRINTNEIWNISRVSDINILPNKNEYPPSKQRYAWECGPHFKHN